MPVGGLDYSWLEASNQATFGIVEIGTVSEVSRHPVLPR
jgi:hypothetical protein